MREVFLMAKSDVIHMRIEPEVKSGAEAILRRLGMSTTDAIGIFLNQVILRGGLPFEVKLPVPNEITLRAMHDAENDINLHKFDTAEEMFKPI